MGHYTRNNILQFSKNEITTEGFFQNLKNKFKKESIAYDSIYSTKEKRIQLIKDVLQIVNVNRRNHNLFARDGSGCDLYKTIQEVSAEYDELYISFIEGKNNEVLIGRYNLWDFAKAIGEINARQITEKDERVLWDFIDSLSNIVTRIYPTVSITPEGGDWDDGPISILIN